MKFFPKNNQFFNLFERQGSHFVRAGEILKDTAENPGNLKNNANKMKDLEHEADIVEHEIVDTMNKTFITPIDREDIYQLNHALDDIIDLIENAFGAAVVYQIKALGPNSIEMMKLAEKACYKVNDALLCIKNLKNNRPMLDHCIAIHSIENEADDLFKKALSEMVSDKVEAMEFIKHREILRAFEDALDKSEEVANILDGIMVKNL